MTYLKCILAGSLAVLAAAILIVVVMVVRLSIAARASQAGAVVWDPISLTSPLTWLAVLGIFLAGFFLAFSRIHSK